jgi:hypothetical protein
MFARDQLPLPKEWDLWMQVTVDTWTGLRASPACSNYINNQDVINVTDPWAAAWLTQTDAGRSWAAENGFKDPLRFVPIRVCNAEDPRPIILISSPTEGQTITNPLIDIFGQINASADFQSFVLYYAVGANPSEYDWKPLMERSVPISQVEKIYAWDLSETFSSLLVSEQLAQNTMPVGDVILRFYLKSTRNTYAELKIRLNFQLPTPTPTATPTLTATPTPTETPTITPTFELTPTSTPTLIPLPTETPSPTGTPTSILVPINTITITPTP